MAAFRRCRSRRSVQESVEDGRGEDGIAEHAAPFNWDWLKLLLQCCSYVGAAVNSGKGSFTSTQCTARR